MQTHAVPASIAALVLSAAASCEAADIESVLAHPIYGATYACSEHWQGSLRGLGDELGSDCTIQKVVEVNGRRWSRAFEGDGSKNEDWYGWGADVLSPCTCAVTEVRENPVVNSPGILGKPPASFIGLRRDDGVNFVLAHVAAVQVKVGEQVTAGQIIAQVGNNGYARQPHIHIGAWRGGEPLQVRFDLSALGSLLQK